MLRIGLVAGETSGDLLGAHLIRAIKTLAPHVYFEGIAGPRMVAAGCNALYPSQALSVMGLTEVLHRLPRLLRIRRSLARYFLGSPPDLFVGIDAPDFNLALERALKSRGITTVHYVSPSIWAWREWRVRKIAAAVDLMLTLFPFEAEFYERQGIAVRFVGHPLADAIEGDPDAAAMRQCLGLAPQGEWVAILPGSRMSEVRSLGASFVQAADYIQRRRCGARFIAPCATPETRALFEKSLKRHTPHLPITLLNGRSQEALAAADVVLTASGTATLEALLLRRPMVVAYRLARSTYWILKYLHLVKIRQFSLPNLLAGQALVREFIQDEATAENLGRAVLELLIHPEYRMKQNTAFDLIHQCLQRDASHRAAEAILDLIPRDR